ncbi:MAG: TIGR03619 family F420-dependent LLM class oxidoreductase [Alphaproteobacteria bacterium]|nr:TIGR03619 family F420-dependent LLM class oxidoreductase [Alphaproteobacteria bacterium]
MRFGFYLPVRGEGAKPDALANLLARGEAAGFHSVMISDHVVIPVAFDSKYPYTVTGAYPGQNNSFEQLSLMAFAAAKTERLRLVSSVMILPHRNPVLTAKMLATIDVLSKGRVTVGVGVGWLREEIEALGAPPFKRRGAVGDEYIEIFKKCWTQDPAEHAGQFYSFKALHCLPHPVQKPHPPIWIGGHSPAALRRVARHGDGWHPVGAIAASPLPPEEMRRHLETIKRLSAAEGRDFAKLAISYKAPLYDAGMPAPGGNRQLFSGNRERIVEDIQAFEKLGISELIFDFRAASPNESVDRLERFAADVMPLVRS